MDFRILRILKSIMAASRSFCFWRSWQFSGIIPLWNGIFCFIVMLSLSDMFFFLIIIRYIKSQQWNESGFKPPLCTYRLNWARRTSWGWWDDWDDTVLQTQDSKFEPWWSEAEHATSRSRRLPTILTFTRGWRRNIFWFFINRRDREPNPELWRERQWC